jgi:hypothetical protein
MQFHPLGKMQLELLKEERLGLGWLSDATVAYDSSLLGWHYHINGLDLSNLVQYFAWLVT